MSDQNVLVSIGQGIWGNLYALYALYSDFVKILRYKWNFTEVGIYKSKKQENTISTKKVIKKENTPKKAIKKKRKKR